LRAVANQFYAEIERLIEASGLQWTFLRPSGFAANTLGWAPNIRAERLARAPYGAARRSLIHEADIAAVAVRALIEDGQAGTKHVLSGPEALTQVEQARAIGEAIGHPVRFEETPPRSRGRSWPGPSGTPPSRTAPSAPERDS
jgi:uncharacterized protein YbjT (DUF2867 family)